LVDILSAVDTDAHAVYTEVVAEWVKSNGVRARRAIGDIVDVRPRATDLELVQIKGEIVSINEEQATYSVFVPGRGHVRTGPGTHAHILPFEEFHELATSPEEFVLSPH
jgi:hypothetical protein